jgi:hypothetical protein
MAMRVAPRLVCIALLGHAACAAAFDWDYSDFRFDLTEQAVFGSSRDVKEWQKAPRESFVAQAARVGGAPARLVSSTESTNGKTRRTDVVIRFPAITDDRADLEYHVVILAPSGPGKAPPRWPIVALDGHGDVNGEGHGQAPLRMFAPGGFADRLVDRGFTVVGIPTAVHKPFARLSETVDYTVIWAELAHRSLALVRPQLPGGGAYYVAGNAIGGLTALSLALIDDNARALYVNGAFFPLELTRREYRIKDHPQCHNFRAFNTYTAVYALLAPRPLMITVGRQDGLWLGNGAAPPSSWFSGLKRGATVDETLGAFLLLERIWKKFDAPLKLEVHPGGHEDIDAQAAGAFFRRVGAPSR